MRIFHTRPAANQGIKVPLSTPDGKPTEYFLTVLGVDSDTFRVRKAEANRNGLLQEALAAGADAVGSSADAIRQVTEAFHRDQKLGLLACLIVGWNFMEDDGTTPKPCTEEKVKSFLIDAPQIADMVDRLAANRALFLAESSKASSSGLGVNLP